MSYSPLSPEQVLAVATLARLEVAPDEIADLQTRLSAILHYAKSLEPLELADIEPLTRIGDSTNRFREDCPGPLLPTKDALNLAPDHFDQYFRVPKVLGDGGGA
jgi:aspartyl-tRNA(Asn)/glutamyl-tRNA(Gln) amidotransferase subunit C